MSDTAIRLSDAERDAAAADLGEHFAQGRLTADEHAQRLDRVWAARTRGEIAPIFRDLPSPYAGASQPASAASRRRDERHRSPVLRQPRRRGFPTPLLVVVGVLIAVAAVGHFPLFLLGLAVFWFVAVRHRRWHRRHGWRY